MRTILLLLAILSTGIQQSAAQSDIKGLVKDEQSKPVSQANVLLLKATDSSMVKGTITNESGAFRLSTIPGGQYLLLVSSAGYRDRYQVLIAEPGKQTDLGTISLKQSDILLGAVTVTARKPLFEQKIDRMVVNVRNSITAAGGTALEVLERSPGVLVDRVNNLVSISGKNGVTVMINGKVNNMPLPAVVQLLAGMNASNIERIEIITTPPANFDAEGNAGFINIVLINNPDKGMNGSWSLTAGYGKRETPAAAFNFNYRQNRVNLYGDYSFSRLHQIQNISNYRKVSSNNQLKENYSESYRDAIQQNHNARLGLDYDISKKTVLGLLLTAFDNKWSMEAENQLWKYINGARDSSVFIPNDEINHWRNITANFNLQHTAGEQESLVLNFNYARFSNRNPTEYLNNYSNAAGDFVYAEQTRSGKITPLTVSLAAVDYKKGWSPKVTMEAGIKLAAFRFTNDVYVEWYKQNTWEADPDLTAKYKLEENIAAAYSSFSVDFSKKTSMKMGLRYEYTTTDLNAEGKPAIVNRKYGRLFPSFFINRKINDNNSLNFSYSRRINRPKLSNLAPFIIFIDPYTFLSGNVNLKPAITDAVLATYTFKKIMFSIGYSYETNTIADFQTSVDVATNKQYLQAQNLENNQLVSATLSVPVTVTKWWNMYTNITAVYQRVQSNLSDNPLTLTLGNTNIFTSQNFTLPKNYSMELSGFLQTASLAGIYRLEAFGRLDIGIQKKFKDNSNLRLNVQDLLASFNWRLVADRPEQSFYTRTLANFSQRIFRLTYTRSFGNKQLKEKRNRNTGSEEELKRVND